jgi:hypothetical protein
VSGAADGGDAAHPDAVVAEPRIEVPVPIIGNVMLVLREYDVGNIQMS